jgi:hypothetical protein
MRRSLTLVATLGAALCALVLSACGSASDRAAVPEPPRFGPAPLYRPDPMSNAVAHARPVAGLGCGARPSDWIGVHLEVFVNRYDVVIPAGIGIAPPHRRDGAYIRGGRCSYPLRTTDPTGMIELARGARATLGQFFAAWGQPLTSSRLLSFRARGRDRVSVFVNGHRWTGPPGALPLTRHAAIMVELGGYVPPRLSYLFPPDL